MENKRGMSAVIGYILLITFAIVIGTIIYSWMKTYVPKDDLICPSGTSLFIKDYDCDSTELNLTLKNNGKFNVGGYFIRVTNESNAGLATIDISSDITSSQGESMIPTGVKFDGNDNSLVPNSEVEHRFDITPLNGIYNLEIIPLRWQEEARRKRLVACKTSVLREALTCN